MSRHQIDPARAAEYLDKRVLVGLTYVSDTGEVLQQLQRHGTIESVDPLLSIREATGERFTLPPEVEPAPPGEYRLRTSGEVVVDPDFLATWEIAPEQGRNAPSGPRGSYVVPSDPLELGEEGS